LLFVANKAREGEKLLHCIEYQWTLPDESSPWSLPPGKCSSFDDCSPPVKLDHWKVWVGRRIRASIVVIFGWFRGEFRIGLRLHGSRHLLVANISFEERHFRKRQQLAMVKGSNPNQSNALTASSHSSSNKKTNGASPKTDETQAEFRQQVVQEQVRSLRRRLWQAFQKEDSQMAMRAYKATAIDLQEWIKEEIHTATEREQCRLQEEKVRFSSCWSKELVKCRILSHKLRNNRSMHRQTKKHIVPP
jgi:hypothetical protein